MDRRVTSSWPRWAGLLTAANVFIATLAARDLPSLQAWRLEFWPSVGISALIAFAVGLLVTIACKKMERARLLHHATVPEYLTRPEEREYITKAATDLNDLMQRPFEPWTHNGKRKAKQRKDRERRNGKKNAAIDDDP